MENKILLVPVMLLFAASVASAIGMEYDETPMLTAVYGDAACRAEFMDGVIGSMIETVPETGYLSEYQDTMDSDLGELYDLAQAGDRAEFKDYLKGTFEPDFSDAKDAMRQARHSYADWNVSFEAKQALLDDYISLNETYAQCRFEAMKDVAEERLNWMNTVLEHYTEKSGELSAKGINTAEIDAAIGDARVVVVEPFESGINSATTALEIKEAMGSYCLGNGCPNGLNYHLAAKAEIAKLNGILNYLEEDAIEAGLGSDVEAAQGYINEADEGVQETGNSQYAEGAGEAVWDSIKSAAETIKDIFSGLRGA